MKTLMVTWFEALSDYTDEEVEKAFRICIRKCKTPPTPADVVEKVEKARDLRRPSKSEVWSMIMDAVDRSKAQVYVADRGFRALYALKNDECRALFQELPQSARKWLGFEAFCSYAEMSTTALNVERARFMKEIDDIRDTIREYRQMSANEIIMLKGE